MAGICTSPYPSPYPIEKAKDSPYPYLVNAGILHQNEDMLGQYPWMRVYLPSLVPKSSNNCSFLVLMSFRNLFDKLRLFRLMTSNLYHSITWSNFVQLYRHTLDI